MNNLLTDPIFLVESSKGLERCNLPTLLAALGEDRVESLTGIQRHQEDAFHIFLCYLGGAVLDRAGRADPVQTETFWVDGLLDLAEGKENAWKLVVDDPSQPAFMQAPVISSETFASFKPKADTPDQLDLLQVAKNHDVKAQRMRVFAPEAWAYALVSLQTMTGLMGRGNYGIARMNSGTGSRIRVGAIYDGGLGAQWRRDVNRLMAYRQDLLAGEWGYRSDGAVLTWTIPWDLKSALPLTRLDPFFVEIARSVRLVVDEIGLRAYGAPTQGMRISAKDLNGLLGDPWTPIVNDGKKIKAWTVMSRFTPKDLRDLIFGDDRLKIPFMQRPAPEQAKQSHRIKLAVLAPGGMGKTNGFYDVEIRVPGKAASLMAKSGPERDRLSKRSKESLGRAGEMQNKVLKPALFSLLEAGPEKIDFDKREVSAWVDQTARRYAEAWAEDFFSWLWASIGEDDESARINWLEYLRELAWRNLQ